MERLVRMISEMGIPYAYSHFEEGEAPEPPFICYLLPGSGNFAADGVVYYGIEEVHVELYTDRKDPEAEKKVTSVLDEHGVFYDRTETWIGSEKLYEVMFIFEIGGIEDA